MKTNRHNKQSLDLFIGHPLGQEPCFLGCLTWNSLVRRGSRISWAGTQHCSTGPHCEFRGALAMKDGWLSKGVSGIQAYTGRVRGGWLAQNNFGHTWHTIGETGPSNFDSLHRMFSRSSTSPLLTCSTCTLDWGWYADKRLTETPGFSIKLDYTQDVNWSPLSLTMSSRMS